MKLRKIELFGFKSFRSKTGIEVGDGITAVVGPNGCGKSNIVDAIRWAMGTQSARSLRGSEMSDVIFAGSRSQKPAGLAEVSLVFDNDESHGVSAADVSQAPLKALLEGSTSVKVTRRLFKSGDTGYLLNGVPVRLKDIRELFLGTGASVRGYSIIEQGQIEFLVNARPKERRSFVEELAGVTRYRYHRQETERKLTATQTNLERLEDLLSEVKQRVTQLKYQAQTAERYVELTRRKRNVEISLLVDSCRTETNALDEAGVALEETIGKYDKQQQALIGSEDELAELEMALTGCEQAHQETTENVYRLQAKCDLLKQSVDHAKLDRERLLEERGRIASDDAELQAELDELRAQLSAVTSDSERLAAPAEDDRDLEGKVRLASSAVSDVEAELERLDGALRDGSARLAEHRARATGWREEIERIADGETSWLERRTQLADAIARSSDDTATIETQIGGIDEEAQLVDQQVVVATEQIERAAHRIEAIRGRIDQVEQSMASCRAERGIKAESVAVEVSQGARQLLDAAEDGQLSGIVGVLSDGIISPPSSERPVHGVLRDLLEYVVVEDADAARRAIEFAETNGLVVGCIENRQIEDVFQPTLGSLLADVQLAEWVPATVAHILDGATTVDELSQSSDGASSALRVDLRGNCASAHGFWRAADPGGGALVRRARLRKEITELDDRLEQLGRSKSKLEDELAQARTEWREAEGYAESRRHDRERIRARRAELEAAIARVNAERPALQSQLDDLEQAQASNDARRQEIANSLTLNDSSIETIVSELTALEQARGSARERRVALRAELEKRQQALAEFQSVQRQQRAEVDRLATERRRVEKAIDRAQDKHGKLATRLREIADRLIKLAIEVDTNSVSADEADQALAQARTDQTSSSDRRDKLRDEQRKRTRATNRRRRLCSDLRLEINQLQIRRDQASREVDRVVQSLSHRFNVDLTQAEEIANGIELPEEPQQLLDELGESIEGLGSINHAAREELAQGRERHDFLCNQQADLVDAIEDMRLTIKELDSVSRAEFRRTFAALRTEFESLFRHLFRGGEATLELDNEQDPLGAGVDVIVRPPGKKVRSMSLLSGGEKALTAVALVFAAFRLKPSPFCILDEVDAPLDTHNVDRFAELLDEMGDDTQFIVITHNRRTMEGAHKLVGVTMDEPGCSRLMAVNIPTPKRATGSIGAAERAAG